MKETYMIVDTDFNTAGFTNLKEAKEYYLEKVEDVIKDSTTFDGDIKFLVVTDSFTKEHLDKYQEVALETVKGEFSFNQPTEAK